MRQLASVRMILLVSALLNVLTYTLASVAATIGGVIAAWRTPGPRLRSFVQHCAVDVIVAAGDHLSMFSSFGNWSTTFNRLLEQQPVG